MRILLCNPPFYRFLGSHYNAHSLGLAYTASVFKRMGHQVSIYNADFSEKKYGSLTGIFDSSLDYHEYFQNEDHPIWDEIVDTILEYNPDKVGYTCYTANLPTIEIISKKVYEKSKVRQIMGGPHVRAICNNYSIAGLGFVDDYLPNVTAFTNESERLFLQLKDINDFPLPDRESFWGLSEEQKKKIDLSYIMTSRGCPYQCTFCANPGIWDKKVYFRSPESVMIEIREMKHKHNIDDFYILDDTFTLNTKRVKSLLGEIEKENIKWRCNTRLDRLDDEVCELMSRSGCIEAKVGVETGSERMLKIIKKGETKDEMRKGIALLKKYNIPITVYLLTGFPEETDEDLQETIDFATEIGANRHSLSIFAPYFGSEVYIEMERRGELSKQAAQYFYHQHPKPLANNKISDKMLEKYFALSKLDKDKRYA